MLASQLRGSAAATHGCLHDAAMRGLVESAIAQSKEQQRQLVAWRKFIRKERQAVAHPDNTLAHARSLIDALTEHARSTVGEQLLSLAALRLSATSRTTPPEPEPEISYVRRCGTAVIDGEPRRLQLLNDVLQLYDESDQLADIIRLVDIVQVAVESVGASPACSVLKLESRDCTQSFVGVLASESDAVSWERSILGNRAALERTAAAHLEASRSRCKSMLEGRLAMEAAAATINERIEDYRACRAQEMSILARARDTVIDAVVEEEVLTGRSSSGDSACVEDDDAVVTLLLCCRASPSAAFSQSDNEALNRQLQRCRCCSQQFLGVASRLLQPLPPECKLSDGNDCESRPWGNAVRELQRVAESSTPTEMLGAVMNTMMAIYRTMDESTDGAGGGGADDLLPIIIYVVIKAQVRDLGARLSFVEKLCNQSIIFSEEGYYFNTLQAALSFLQHLKPPTAEDDPSWALEPEQLFAPVQEAPKLSKRLPHVATSSIPVTDAGILPGTDGDNTALSLSSSEKSTRQMAQRAIGRSRIWREAKLRYGRLGGASPPCSPTPRLASEERAGMTMFGPLNVQLNGEGEFVTVNAELVSGELRFEVFDVRGRMVVQTLSVLGATIRQPKHRRKGHPTAIRVDLAQPELVAGATSASEEHVRKFIFDAGTAELLESWRDALGHHAAGAGDNRVESADR